MIWSRSYQRKFSVVLVIQQPAFLDSILMDMDRICQCSQSDESADHLAETLRILAAVPIELSKMVSFSMLLASSCRNIISGSPTLFDIRTFSTIAFRQFFIKMSDRILYTSLLLLLSSICVCTPKRVNEVVLS